MKAILERRAYKRTTLVLTEPQRRLIRALIDARDAVLQREARSLAVAPDWEPLCMDADEWATWQRLNPKLTSAHDRVVRPCPDCPADYARQMLRAGKCNGTPAVAA